MSDFTLVNSENCRFPQFSVKPSHIGEGLVGMDVSFASFLCAKEKEGDKAAESCQWTMENRELRIVKLLLWNKEKHEKNFFLFFFHAI